MITHKICFAIKMTKKVSLKLSATKMTKQITQVIYNKNDKKKKKKITKIIFLSMVLSR